MPIRVRLVEIKSSPSGDDRLLCDLMVDDVAERVVEMMFEGGTQHFVRLDANGVRKLVGYLEERLQPIELEAHCMVDSGDYKGAGRLLSGGRR